MMQDQMGYKIYIFEYHQRKDDTSNYLEIVNKHCKQQRTQPRTLWYIRQYRKQV